MRERAKHFYEFGPFRVDATERQLLRGEEVVPLTPKLFDILLVLVSDGGHILEKNELLKAVWGDAVVEEGNLTRNVSTLRKALGDDPDEPQFIETVPWRGYRFVASVREVGDGHDDLVVEAHSRARVVIEEEQETDDEGRRVKLGSPTRAKSFTAGRAVKLVSAAALTALIFTLAGIVYFSRGKPINSLAVLPFTNAGADPNTEYLSEGITESLINSLSQLPNVKVISRASVFRYKGREIDPQSVGRELNIGAVLVGSATQRGDNIIVSVELIDARDKSHIWGEQYKRKLSDLLAIQGEISRDVTAKLRLRLTGEEQKRLTKNYTENVEAYQLYLKGRYFWNKRTPEAQRKGIENFEQAIDKDPDYALAYAGLADCYIVLGVQGVFPPGESFLKAKAAATKALELDDTLAEAHTSLGLVKTRYDWDWPGAEAAFKRAIELNPRYATAHQWYGEYLNVLGRHDEAITEIRRAQELDPLSLIINTVLGGILLESRRPDQAIEQIRKTLEMDQNFFWGHRDLGRAYLEKGMYEEAIAEFQKAVDLSRSDQVAGSGPVSLLGYAYAVSGKRVAAQRVLSELEEQSKQHYVSPFSIATIYTGLGDKDHAFTWFEKAYKERSVWLPWLKPGPEFDSLRSDPRFINLMQRVGLTP